jgi:hypothetical protein
MLHTPKKQRRLLTERKRGMEEGRKKRRKRGKVPDDEANPVFYE